MSDCIVSSTTDDNLDDLQQEADNYYQELKSRFNFNEEEFINSIFVESFNRINSIINVFIESLRKYSRKNI